MHAGAADIDATPLLDWSPRNFRSGRAFQSSPSARPERTTPFIAWAKTWSSVCLASSRRQGRLRGSANGCRDLRPACRLPSLSPSRKGCLPKATHGIGLSTDGWKERPRPSTASPIRSKPRPSWVSSSPHCSGLIPQVGRPLMSTTLSEVYLCHAGIPPPETRSGGCATHSMPPRSSLHGKRPSMRRCGRVGTYGYTVTSMQRTCWPDTGD